MLNRLRFWLKKVHNADIAALPVNFSICAVVSKRQLYNSVEVGMKLIFCIDEKKGMMFFGKRQSQDSVLREHVAKLVANVPLWMNHYSASQFDTESIPNLNIDDAFLQEAAQGEYCFVEDAPLAPFEKWIERIAIFRWDRTYPADRYFDLQLGSGQWHLVGTSEFAGHSHDLITMEVYER